MGPLYILAIGAVVGAGARLLVGRRAPRRIDVAMILAAVGAGLGALGYAMSTDRWSAIMHFSPGMAVAAIVGATMILLAFRVLPRVAPSLVHALPGRDQAVRR